MLTSLMRHRGAVLSSLRALTASQPHSQQSLRFSHADDTNTFVQEVRQIPLCRSTRVPLSFPTHLAGSAGIDPEPRGKQMHRDLRSWIVCWQAFNLLEFDSNFAHMLMNPNRELTVELVIPMDSGEVEVFNAYRVQHNNSRGPFKGGLRFHPQVDLDDVRRCVENINGD